MTDLSPRTGPDTPPTSGRTRRRWLPIVVLAVVLVAGGVIVTQFLRSAVDYYCNVDEVGQRSGCDRDRRLRLQGVVERGTVSSGGDTDFVIAFNGVAMPVHYDGEPGGIFKECIPVVVHGHFDTAATRSSATGSRSSTPTSTSRSMTTGSTRPTISPIRARPELPEPMIAISLNGALGHFGLLLMLAASFVGALSTGLAIVVGNRKGVRQATVYAWLILAGALISVIAMQRALDAATTRSTTSNGSGRRRRPASTTWRRCGVRSRVRSCCGSSCWRSSPLPSRGDSAAAPTTRSSPGRWW